jgi:hypothetical protein
MDRVEHDRASLGMLRRRWLRWSSYPDRDIHRRGERFMVAHRVGAEVSDCFECCINRDYRIVLDVHIASEHKHRYDPIPDEQRQRQDKQSQHRGSSRHRRRVRPSRARCDTRSGTASDEKTEEAPRKQKRLAEGKCYQWKSGLLERPGRSSNDGPEVCAAWRARRPTN